MVYSELLVSENSTIQIGGMLRGDDVLMKASCYKKI